MVRVRFEQGESLASCANFLSHAFPGEVTQDGDELHLSFAYGQFQSHVEIRIVERLLWAWRIENNHQRGEDGVITTGCASDLS